MFIVIQVEFKIEVEQSSIFIFKSIFVNFELNEVGPKCGSLTHTGTWVTIVSYNLRVEFILCKQRATLS